MNLSQSSPRLGKVSRLISICLFLPMLAVVAAGQQPPSWSATTGATPASMSPGAPVGSYPLSGFETINLYSRRQSFSLPLVHVGGRGAAGFTIQLPLGFQWQEYNYSYPTNCGQGGCGGWQQVTVPIPTDWAYQPTFSPGIMIGRNGYVSPHDCGGYSRYDLALTRLTFRGSDGSEYEFRDVTYDGQPRATTCAV